MMEIGFYGREPCFFVKDEIFEPQTSQSAFKEWVYPFQREKFEEIYDLICSYLNTGGGEVFIGVDKSKKVVGLDLNREDQDELNRELAYCLAQVVPPISLTAHIKIDFIRVKNNQIQEPGLCVVRIQVKKPKDCDRYYSRALMPYNSLRTYWRTNAPQDCEINLSLNELKRADCNRSTEEFHLDLRKVLEWLPSNGHSKQADYSETISLKTKLKDIDTQNIEITKDINSPLFKDNYNLKDLATISEIVHRLNETVLHTIGLIQGKTIGKKHLQKRAGDNSWRSNIRSNNTTQIEPINNDRSGTNNSWRSNLNKKV